MSKSSNATAIINKAGRKRLIILFLAGGLGLAGAAYGIHWWKAGRFLEYTNDAYVGGNITAISPHMGGFIKEILVQDNQFVHSGQVLLTIDDRDAQAAIGKADAVLRKHKAILSVLNMRKEHLILAADQTKAELAAKIVRVTGTSRSSDRYHGSVSHSTASTPDARPPHSEDEISSAAMNTAMAALADTHQELTIINHRLAQAQASVDEATADLRQAELNLSYTIIKSPIDGYIGNRATQIGSFVSSGTYLLSVVPAHGLWIDANFKEDQLAHMEAGQIANIEADARPGHIFHGHILSLAPATGATFSVIPPQNATGNFTKIVQRVPVRISLDSDEAILGAIRPGLSTEVTVDTRGTQGTSP